MADISRAELDEIYDFAVQLGKEAGQMLLDAAKLRMGDGAASREQKEHVEKENAVDLVTETDEGKLLLSIGLKIQAKQAVAWEIMTFTDNYRRGGIYQDSDYEQIPFTQVSVPMVSGESD
jgi:hypothetical protein